MLPEFPSAITTPAYESPHRPLFDAETDPPKPLIQRQNVKICISCTVSEFFLPHATYFHGSGLRQLDSPVLISKL
jgi:hypothetical protein